MKTIPISSLLGQFRSPIRLIEKAMTPYKTAYVLLPTAFVILYHEVFRHIIYKWMTPEGSYGPMILMVSFYLVWINRHEIQQLRPDPALPTGGLLLAAGLFIFFAGNLSSTILAQMVSIVPVLLGIILLLAGPSFLKALLLPVGYLLFLTGFIEQLLGSVSIYLQQITAWIAVLFFKLIGWPVLLNATIIELPHISLEVVRSCSGINHLVALIALAVPLAFLTQKTVPNKIALIVSSVFIGIFANGLRVALIGIYAFYNKGADIHGPSETLYVSFIFFFGLVVLIIVSRILSRITVTRQPQESTGVTEMALASPGPGSFAPFKEKQRYSILIAAILFATTIGFVQFYTPLPTALKRTLDEFPGYIAGFTATELDYIDERLRPFPADEELLRRYADHEGRQLDIYIGYFASQDRNRKIIDSRRDWMHQEVSRISFNDNEADVIINKTRLKDRTNPADVYFWYTLDGRIITNQYAGKIATFLNGLLKRRTNATLIVISTQNEENEIRPLIAEMIKAVRNHS